MSQFLAELLAAATFLGISARLCTGVPAPLYALLPIFLFVPFVARDFPKMSPDLISAVADSLTAIAAIVGASFAWVGVNAWRQQLIGENEYQLSVRLQELLFEIQKEVRSIRRNHEDADRDTVFRAAMVKPGSELDSLTLKGRAHWGDKYHELFMPVLNAINELKHELHVHSTAPKEYLAKHLDRIYAVTHANEDETDTFSVKWNKAFKDLEMFLKQYIKK